MSDDNEKAILERFEGADPDFQSEGRDFNQLDKSMCFYPQSDLGNSQRLRKRFGDDLIYVKGSGWHGWSVTHWSAENGEALSYIRAHSVAKTITKRETAALFDNGKMINSIGLIEGAKDFKKRIDRLASWGIKSGDINRTRGMLDQAKPYLSKEVKDLNSDPYLMAVNNGTLVLDRKRGRVTIKKSVRGDLITQVSPAQYRPKDDCPIFSKFLQDIIPDPEVRRFLQKWFGYCLTGDISEQCLVFFFGGGANGKSTLVETIGYILGSYDIILGFESLQVNPNKTGAQASPDIADMPGKRFVRASEPDNNVEFSTGLVKGLTGGEKLKARQLHKAFFHFMPSHKIILSGNSKPRVRGNDHGIWRRFHLVPFLVQIDDKDKDLLLPMKLKNEASGILNWMVEGFSMWVKEGLDPPSAVVDATLEYRKENDPIGKFLDDCTAPSPGSRVSAYDLYARYKKWAALDVQKVWLERAFGLGITEHGIKKTKVSTNYYLDIKIIEEDPDEVPHVGEGEDPNL